MPCTVRTRISLGLKAMKTENTPSTFSFSKCQPLFRICQLLVSILFLWKVPSTPDLIVTCGRISPIETYLPILEIELQSALRVNWLQVNTLLPC